MLTASKIAVGSCIAIYIATWLNLEFATSAGSITLLTLLTTKWDTLKLSLVRIITFVIAVAVSYVFFEIVCRRSDWAAYGLFTFVMTIMLESVGMRAALSVNAVIGTHFLMTDNYTKAFIINEFLLVMIGISIAIVLNLFNNNRHQKKIILNNVMNTEMALTGILGKIGLYMQNKPIHGNVWEELNALEKDLSHYVDMAYEFQNNTFSFRHGYYIDYFKMRTKQCNVLHNLHYELRRIRSMPKQAKIISDYVLYLKNFVNEMNDPAEQIERLEKIFDDMKKEELPKTRDEFENRAKLYHVLMDLEDFLIYKRRFIILMKKGRLENTIGPQERIENRLKQILKMIKKKINNK